LLGSFGTGSGAAKAESAANANNVTNEVVEYLIVNQLISTADNRKRPLVTRFFVMPLNFPSSSSSSSSSFSYPFTSFGWIYSDLPGFDWTDKTERLNLL
jgi:hypothetical protein